MQRGISCILFTTRLMIHNQSYNYSSGLDWNDNYNLMHAHYTCHINFSLHFQLLNLLMFLIWARWTACAKVQRAACAGQLKGNTASKLLRSVGPHLH